MAISYKWLPSDKLNIEENYQYNYCKQGENSYQMLQKTFKVLITYVERFKKTNIIFSTSIYKMHTGHVYIQPTGS